MGTRTVPESSAILDLNSVTQGFLAPRMDTVERDAIVLPANGLIIYNTDLNQIQLWNGGAWVAVGGGNLQQTYDTGPDGVIELANALGKISITDDTVTPLGGTLFDILDTGLTEIFGVDANGVRATRADVDNIRIDGNTISSTDANGDITLDANGTGVINASDDLIVFGAIDTDSDRDLTIGGSITTQTLTLGGGVNSLTVISGDLQVDGTTTTVNSTTLDVAAAKVNTNVGGNQASANAGDSGIEINMTDATNAGLAYDSSLNSRFKIGEVGAYEEVITDDHTQTMTNKIVGLEDGAVGGPSLNFDSSATTGLFSDAANTIGVSSNSTEILELDGTSIDATVPLNTSSSSTIQGKLLTGSAGPIDASAQFEVVSTIDGSIPCPKMTEVQRDAVVAPVNGLCIFNTDTAKLNVYDGTDWVSAGGGIDKWEATTNYKAEDVIWEPASRKIYYSNADFTSGGAFVVGNWTELAIPSLGDGLEFTGATDVLRVNLDETNALTESYLERSANGLRAKVLDEDAMASDSNLHLPTQQSVKAYVDNSLGATTIQDIYNNSNPASAVLDGTNNGIRIEDNGTPIGVDLFEVTDNGNANEFFKVDVLGAYAPRVDVDNVRIDGNDITSLDVNGNLNLNPNGTGVIDLQKVTNSLDLNTTGTHTVTGQSDIDNITIDGNDISSSDVNGNITLTPNGTGQSLSSNDFVFNQSALFDEIASTSSTIGANRHALRFDSTSSQFLKEDENGVINPVDRNEQDEVNLLANRSFEESFTGSEALSWSITDLAVGTGGIVPAIETTTKVEGKQSVDLAITDEGFYFDQVISIDQYDGKVVGFSCEINSTENVDVCFMEGTTELSCTTKNKADKWVKSEVLGSVISGNTYGIRIKSDVAITDNVYIDKCEFTSNPLNFKESLKNQFLEYGTTQDLFQDHNQEARFPTTLTSASFSGPQHISIEDDATNTRTKFVANESVAVDVTWSVAIATATEFTAIYRNGKATGSTINISEYQTTSNFNAVVTAHFEMDAGEFFTMGANSNIRNSASGSSYLNIKTTRRNPQIIENADIVSSENITFNFKSTAIDCDVDPIGTFNTFSKASSSNTMTLCATNDAAFSPDNISGIPLRAVPYNQARGCTTTAEPTARVDICVGKGLKGLKVFGYSGTNRSGNELEPSIAQESSSSLFGLWRTYNESTGVLSLDTGHSLNSSTTSRLVRSPKGAASHGNSYWHFALSKNPIVNAIDAVPRVDYSWENDFVAKIDGDATCAVLSENVKFIDSCSRSAAGAYSVTFVAGFFSQIPAVTVESSSNSDNNDVEVPYNVTTSGFDVRTRGNSGTNADSDFIITASRLGSDYRSRGDAAAIIAQPSCILKDKRDSGQAGGTFTSGSYQTRVFDSALEGDCSFLTAGSLTADTNMLSDFRFSDFTLAKGTYKIEAYVPSRGVGNSVKAKLYNTTDSTDAIIGKSLHVGSADDYMDSVIMGQITIAGSKDFEVQHRCFTTRAGDGFGTATSFGDEEVYTTLKITKIK